MGRDNDANLLLEMSPYADWGTVHEDGSLTHHYGRRSVILGGFVEDAIGEFYAFFDWCSQMAGEAYGSFMKVTREIGERVPTVGKLVEKIDSISKTKRKGS